MLYLNNTSNKIIDRILAIGNGEKAFTINNEPGSFMPLHVEILPEIVIPALGLCRNISLAHYGEQNGDLMRDPEMCILQTVYGCRIAYYFRNDYAGYERCALDPETDTLNPKQVHDHNEFLSTWLLNICDQQGINHKQFAS